MLSFLFPPICPLCAKELLDKGEHICKICSKKQIFIKEPTCYSCGKSMKNQEKEYCSDCRQHPKNFERGMGLCIYQKPVTDSLAAIKYKNERKFAQYYLEEIRKRKYRELLRLKADAVIPVPIHKKKRRKRGFNQAEIFAKGIAEMLNQPMYTKIVERIHDTKPQKQLSPGERKNNLKKAFRGNLKEYQKAGIAVPRIADTVLLEYPPRSPNVTIVVNTATMIVNTIGEIPRYIIGNIIPIIHANANTRLKIA